MKPRCGLSAVRAGFLMTAGLLVFSACSGAKDKAKSNAGQGGPGSTGTGSTGATLSTSLIVASSASATQLAPFTDDFNVTAMLGDSNNFYNVAAPANKIESLKLFISSISICKELTLNGTAASYGGCLELYKGPDENVLTNSGDLAAAYARAENVTDGYIDLMREESRKKIDQAVTLTKEKAGEYAYGTMSWAAPIKVKAVLVDPKDGTTERLYTKASKPGKCQVNNNPSYDCMVATSPLTSGPAEEAIIGGGGTINFKFQKPLVVTEADIEKKTAFSLRLAFNPEGLLQGVTPNGATNFPSYTDATINDGYNLGNSLAFVGAQVAPIFFKSSSRIKRASYSAIVPAGGGNGTFKLRLELYSLSDDPDQAIYGATIATLPTADYSGYLVGWRTPYGVKTNEDGSVDLLNYDKTSFLAGFQRKTAVGETTSAQLECDTVSFGCTNGQTFAATFTLDALEDY